MTVPSGGSCHPKHGSGHAPVSLQVVSPPRCPSPREPPLPQPRKEGSGQQHPRFLSAESSRRGAVTAADDSAASPTLPERRPQRAASGAILQCVHLHASDPRLCPLRGACHPLGCPPSAPPGAPVTTLMAQKALSASQAGSVGRKPQLLSRLSSDLDVQTSQLLQLGPGLVTHKHTLP